MQEIKVQCDCGQKYKFEVEPVNGRMPYPVHCPLCNKEGTDKANAILQEQLGAFAAPPPAHAAAVAAVAAAPAVSEAPRLRISATAHAPAASSGSPPVPSPVQAARPISPMAAARPQPKNGEGNFVLGSVGAVAGGFVGMMIWYFLIKATHFEIGYVAWGVGLLTGFGARILGKAGSTMLGVVAGACALFAIVGGEYLYAKSEVDKSIQEVVDTAYQSQMDYAKEAEAVKTDAEVKAFLMKHEGEEPTPEQIKNFREVEQPKLKDFAAGKPSKAEFGKQFSKITDSFIYKLLLLKESVGLFTILWILLGVSSAYKLGAG